MALILLLALIGDSSTDGLTMASALDDTQRVRVVTPLLGLANLDLELRRFTDANREFARVLEVLDNHDLASPILAELKARGLSGLALATLRLRGPEEGSRVAQEALDYARRRFGPEHGLTALAENQMGIVHQPLRCPEQAEAV